MADNQADDDDDESFGDFKFASLPNQTFSSNQINAKKDFSADDDGWGDFINHSGQINGGSAHTNGGLFFPSNSPSKLGVSQDPTQKNLANVKTTSEKPMWNKPQGALPLSIFGAEEEEEPAGANLAFAGDANIFANKNAGSVNKESDSNGTIKINDLLANFYNQRPLTNSDNGSISISNGSDLNWAGTSSNVISSISTVAASNGDANGLNSNLSNLNFDLANEIEDTGDDDDGWEFKSAEPEIRINSEDIKVEHTKHETTNGTKDTFRFDNGPFDVGDMLNSSSKISQKADQWNLGFEFSPSSAVQNHVSPQSYQRGEFNDTKNGDTAFNKNFGELKNVHSESGLNHSFESPKLAAVYPVSAEVLKIDGEGPSGPDNQHRVPESHQSDQWGFDFNSNPNSFGEDRQVSEVYSKREQDDLSAYPANSNVDYDVNLFESKDAVTGITPNLEKSQISSENHREALSLSLFGDEIPDTNEDLVFQGFSTYAPPSSSIRNSSNSPGSNLSFNDLISNLYSQAEHKTSPHSTPKASENGQVVAESNLVTGDDNFNDDSWEFKDASHVNGLDDESIGITLSNQEPQVSENVPQPLSTVSNSDLINGDDSFEDDSWEFKDASYGTNSHYQASVIDHRDLPMPSSTKLEPPDYVDFYCKLKDELCNVIRFHIQNLKNDQSVAILPGEDATTRALSEEIQEFSDILHQYNIFPNEYVSENHSTRNASLCELIEVLKEPKFQSLESEYKLTSRLSMAETNMRSAVELLKDAAATLRIFKLGSREEQSSYLTTWYKIVSICSQELKHGASIWKQSVHKNVHDQILSSPQGFRYIHALGEIYRVAEIIGASVKLHRPWILSNSVDTVSFFALLNECYSAWSDSGLEEALIHISNESNLKQDGILRELIESIKYIHELDEHALQTFVITGEETTCRLSALPAGFMPGIKMVTWNGKQYFLTVANLWVNLISSYFPNE